MMKKILALIFCVSLVLSLSACGLDKNDNPISSTVAEEPSFGDFSESEKVVSEKPQSQESSVPPSSTESPAASEPQASSVPLDPEENLIAHEPQKSSTPPVDADPFGLLGEGQGDVGIALTVIDSSTGKLLELDKTEGGEFLSKIDFNQFVSAKMEEEIVPPNTMTGEVGTVGNYICIGMPHTNMLYIYDTQAQALLIGAGNKYYDIPSGVYNSIKAVLDNY